MILIESELFTQNSNTFSIVYTSVDNIYFQWIYGAANPKIDKLVKLK